MAILYPAIEAADQSARDFFGERPIDSALYPNLVRYHLKRALAARGLVAVDDDELVLEHKVLANNGLLLTYGSRLIRIRKSDRGTLPAAASQTMRDFYEQGSLFDEAIETQNLVLLWDVATGIVELRLVCPKTRDGAIHWSQSVPHPAEAQPPVHDETTESADDLGYSLPEDEASADEEE